MPDQRRYETRLGTYEILEAMRPGSYGSTYIGRVVQRRRDSGSKVRRPYGPRKSQQVVLKMPKIDQSRAPEENRWRLKEVHDTFEADYMALQRLVDVSCVAHVLDHGSFDMAIGPQEQAAALFTVHEFVDGDRLDNYLTDHYGDSGVFDGIRNATEYFRWAEKIVTSIIQIHQQTVIHGDIWPENIMINREDEVVLIDFGQALFRDTMPWSPREYRGGAHAYVAPQGSGGESGDIFALGGVLYYLATGNPPAAPHRNMAALKTRITEELKAGNPDLYNGNPGVADIIARCLRFDHHERAQTAEEVLQDIRAFAMQPTDSPMIPRLPKVEIENPLFKLIASRMTSNLAQELHDLSNGFCAITGSHNDLVRGLVEYLSGLGNEDRYLTLTRPMLWTPGNLGVNGRFVTMNRLAAQRGATIRRVFLLTEAEASDSNYLEILRAHADVMRDLEKLGIPSDKGLKSGGYWAGYVVMDRPRLRLEERKGSHFGLLIRQERKTWVFPIYRYRENERDDAVLVRLEFKSRDIRDKDLLAYFNKVLKDATSLVEGPPAVIDLREPVPEAEVKERRSP